MRCDGHAGVLSMTTRFACIFAARGQALRANDIPVADSGKWRIQRALNRISGVVFLVISLHSLLLEGSLISSN